MKYVKLASQIERIETSNLMRRKLRKHVIHNTVLCRVQRFQVMLSFHLTLGQIFFFFLIYFQHLLFQAILYTNLIFNISNYA